MQTIYVTGQISEHDNRVYVAICQSDVRQKEDPCVLFLYDNILPDEKASIRYAMGKALTLFMETHDIDEDDIVSIYCPDKEFIDTINRLLDAKALNSDERKLQTLLRRSIYKPVARSSGSVLIEEVNTLLANAIKTIENAN